MFVPVFPHLFDNEEEKEILFSEGVVLDMQKTKASDIKMVCEKMDAYEFEIEKCIKKHIPSNAEILSIQFMPIKIEYGRVIEVMMIASYTE